MSNILDTVFFFHLIIDKRLPTTMRGQKDESLWQIFTRNEISISLSPLNSKKETKGVKHVPEHHVHSIVSMLVAVQKALVRYSVGELQKYELMI